MGIQMTHWLPWRLGARNGLSSFQSVLRSAGSEGRPGSGPFACKSRRGPPALHGTGGHGLSDAGASAGGKVATGSPAGLRKSGGKAERPEDIMAQLEAQRARQAEQLKMEARARQELEDMLLRIERHFKAGQGCLSTGRPRLTVPVPLHGGMLVDCWPEDDVLAASGGASWLGGWHLRVWQAVLLARQSPGKLSGTSSSAWHRCQGWQGLALTRQHVHLLRTPIAPAAGPSQISWLGGSPLQAGVHFSHSSSPVAPAGGAGCPAQGRGAAEAVGGVGGEAEDAAERGGQQTQVSSPSSCAVVRCACSAPVALCYCESDDRNIQDPAEQDHKGMEGGIDGSRFNASEHALLGTIKMVMSVQCNACCAASAQALLLCAIEALDRALLLCAAEALDRVQESLTTSLLKGTAHHVLGGDCHARRSQATMMHTTGRSGR